MAEETSVQSGPGGPQSVTGGGRSSNSNALAGQAEGDAATGNLTSGGGLKSEQSPASGGLARVLAGQAEAGGERVTTTGNKPVLNSGQPDPAGQPKRNPEPGKSNDNLSVPTWAEQLPRKMAADPNVIGQLSAFKSLGEFVQAYLDAQAGADGGAISLPGSDVPSADSAPEDIQAFYERLGKPKEAGGYSFAKNDGALAKAAFDANLTSSQADALYATSMAQIEAMRKGVQAGLASDIQATDALLQKEYGDKYGEAIALLGRGMGNNPKTGELSPVAQSLVSAGLAGKPEIVRAFIELGRATSEGMSAGGKNAAGMPGSVMEGRGFSYKDSYYKE